MHVLLKVNQRSKGPGFAPLFSGALHQRGGFRLAGNVFDWIALARHARVEVRIDDGRARDRRAPTLCRGCRDSTRRQKGDRGEAGQG